MELLLLTSVLIIGILVWWFLLPDSHAVESDGSQSEIDSTATEPNLDTVDVVPKPKTQPENTTPGKTCFSDEAIARGQMAQENSAVVVVTVSEIKVHGAGMRRGEKHVTGTILRIESATPGSANQMTVGDTFFGAAGYSQFEELYPTGTFALLVTFSGWSPVSSVSTGILDIIDVHGIDQEQVVSACLSRLGYTEEVN